MSMVCATIPVTTIGHCPWTPGVRPLTPFLIKLRCFLYKVKVKFGHVMQPMFMSSYELRLNTFLIIYLFYILVLQRSKIVIIN